ncbi:MAG: NADP(H)-dependent aldo-keto reductase [Alphaproteobacteria bacterium]
MQTRPLGWSGLEVSDICLGTMTFGQQNSEADGHAQMDYALDHGVNFIDTAEMYSVPARAETYGRTEEIVGTWLAARRNRDRIILATKVAGPTAMHWIRDNRADLDRRNIIAALDASLKRLRTDYVDLYQLHWPSRPTNCFGKLGYVHQPDAHAVPIEESHETLAELVKAGKIRHFGLSNETPWGLAAFLRLAESRGWPRPVSIQNPYSLVNRTFEVGLAEMAIREECGLLGYSPLGFGTLSGKYLRDQHPADSRLTLFGDKFPRYQKPLVGRAVEEYVALAESRGLDPAQMAIAFACHQPFMTSVIIGATRADQLAADIAAADIILPPDLLEEIEKIHARIPNPAP